MGVATRIELTDDERRTLETWVRRTTTEQRMVQRARIVLESGSGKDKEGARRLVAGAASPTDAAFLASPQPGVQEVPQGIAQEGEAEHHGG